jgi:hypothetical protein|tara:strand:- start:205 stop:564 length:360 start_codon:yes stop_codon:yes gene_type:complete
VIKQQYLKQADHDYHYGNDYLKQLQTSSTDINYSGTNSNCMRKRDPTKLLKFSNIDFDSFKPNMVEIQKSFYFSAKDREEMNYKGPEFKFRDYHDLIDAFITKKEEEPPEDDENKSDHI